MGFTDAGMMFYEGKHEFLSGGAPLPQFAYLKLVEDIKYRHGSDLSEEFETTIETDCPNIDLSQDQYYWTSDDNVSLDELLISGFQAVQTAEFRMRTPEAPCVVFKMPRLRSAAE
jgi:hypothetical protein